MEEFKENVAKACGKPKEWIKIFGIEKGSVRILYEVVNPENDKILQ